MAKNYADIYNSTNDSSALEQRFYIKEEVTRGTFAAATDSDFLFTLDGGSISFNQPFDSSPHRSGRHHTDIIKKKKELNWSLSTFINIDTGVGAGTSELDTGMRVLWKSLLGKEDTTAGVVYTSETAPNITFSLYEVGDKWSRQARGCFVQSGNLQFPGDGEATNEWSGQGKDALFIGVGKSTVDNNLGNTITVGTDEGKRYQVGGLVMIIEADGVTRSADTPNGSPRTITDVTGDVITVDGAVLADADGGAAEIYLSYYEPEAPTGINNPITGLEGSVSIVGLNAAQCIRSASFSMNNNHEVVDYCFGSDSLAAPFFVPADRFTAEVTIEMNVNDDTIAFFNEVQAFDSKDLTLILGDATTRHLQVETPKVRFPVPEFSVPETGSIPVSYTGNAYQTALDAADEITVSYL